jgi:DNA-directed RNA polymerase subunit RPC12/RpoP
VSPRKSKVSPEYPCPVCFEIREMRSSKKNKPYLVCDECGVQVFIRNKVGINRIAEIRNNAELWDKLISSTIFDSSKLIKLNALIGNLRAEILELENYGSLFPEEAEENTIEILGSKLRKLEAQYRDELGAF